MHVQIQRMTEAKIAKTLLVHSDPSVVGPSYGSDRTI